jgi:hypothetical protein
MKIYIKAHDLSRHYIDREYDSTHVPRIGEIIAFHDYQYEVMRVVNMIATDRFQSCVWVYVNRCW